jgi:hypothetical protein
LDFLLAMMAAFVGNFNDQAPPREAGNGDRPCGITGDIIGSDQGRRRATERLGRHGRRGNGRNVFYQQSEGHFDSPKRYGEPNTKVLLSRRIHRS